MTFELPLSSVPVQTHVMCLVEGLLLVLVLWGRCHFVCVVNIQ